MLYPVNLSAGTTPDILHTHHYIFYHSDYLVVTVHPHFQFLFLHFEAAASCTKRCTHLEFVVFEEGLVYWILFCMQESSDNIKVLQYLLSCRWLRGKKMLRLLYWMNNNEECQIVWTLHTLFHLFTSIQSIL